MTRRLAGRAGRLIWVPLMATAYIGAAACASGDGAPPPAPDYVAACTDARTGERVDDDRCGRAPMTYDRDDNDGSSPFLWYYLGTLSSQTYAPVGSHVYGGTYYSPRSPGQRFVVSRAGSIPRSGGAASNLFASKSSPGGAAPKAGTSGSSPVQRGGFGVKGSTGGGSSGS